MTARRMRAMVLLYKKLRARRVYPYPVVALWAAVAAHPDATLIRDVAVDPAARGQVTFFNTANVGSFQQDGLLTYRGFQYAAWYRHDGRAMIARRRLPSGRWQRVELDYDLIEDDAHNTISMVVTPEDGRIHVAFATHTFAIRYARSRRGVAGAPHRIAWSSASFEAPRTELPGAPGAPMSWTYPQFETVRGRTFLTYRDGLPHDGRQVLLRYNGRGTWTMLGHFTDSRGEFRSRYGLSTSRYAYLHGFTANPVNGNLEIAFTWREQPSAWCARDGIGNHDLGYAYSANLGATWRNNAGVAIGRTGPFPATDLISIADRHVVVRQPIDRGLINQEAQAPDSRGRLHVMTSMVPDTEAVMLGGCVSDFYARRARYARPIHAWRDRAGRWQTMVLPTRLGGHGRSKIAFDRRDNAYVVLPDARIMAATARSGWTDWRIVFGARGVDNVGELILDRQRLRRDGVLSVAYQVRGVAADAPSAYRVADFRLTAPRRIRR